MVVQIKRAPNTVIESVEIDEGAVYRHQLMGEHKVSLSTIVKEAMDVSIGDYSEVGAQVLRINEQPEVIRESATRLKYSIIFEGEIYNLYDKLFMDEGSADFSYSGDPSLFIV